MIVWVTTAIAQQEQSDFWRNRQLRDDTIHHSNLQLSTQRESLLSAYQQCLYVIRQDYVLEKGGYRYVQYGKDYYGRRTGVGFAFRDQFLTTLGNSEPWTEDVPDLSGNGYAGIHTWVSFKSLADSNYTIIREHEYKILYSDSFAMYQSLPVKPDSLLIADRKDNGVVLLVFDQEKSNSIELSVFDAQIRWDRQQANLAIPFGTKQLIGGFFFVPDTLEGSQVFALSGLIFPVTHSLATIKAIPAEGFSQIPASPPIKKKNKSINDHARQEPDRFSNKKSRNTKTLNSKNN